MHVDPMRDGVAVSRNRRSTSLLWALLWLALAVFAGEFVRHVYEICRNGFAGLWHVSDSPRLVVVPPRRWCGGHCAWHVAVRHATLAQTGVGASLDWAGVCRRHAGGHARRHWADCYLARADDDPRCLRSDGSGMGGGGMCRPAGHRPRAARPAPALDGAGIPGDAGAGGVSHRALCSSWGRGGAFARHDRRAALGELGGAGADPRGGNPPGTDQALAQAHRCAAPGAAVVIDAWLKPASARLNAPCTTPPHPAWVRTSARSAV